MRVGIFFWLALVSIAASARPDLSSDRLIVHFARVLDPEGVDSVELVCAQEKLCSIREQSADEPPRAGEIARDRILPVIEPLLKSPQGIEGAQAPLLTWWIQYGDKRSSGTVFRTETLQRMELTKKKKVEALLLLENIVFFALPRQK